MTFQSLVDNLTNDTLRVSLPLFRPELIICATIVILLLVRVFRFGYKLDPFWLALLGAFLAFYYAIPAGGIRGIGEVHRQEIFTGMLIYDSMTVFFRMFLLAFAFWFIILVRITGLADKQDGQDFYTLLLGSTLGMCLMASANHLMTVFLSVEMASVPSYVMAGIIKGRRRASEASLKYAVYGAGAAGVMLYGISLLAGLTGSAHLPTIATKLAAMDIPGMIGRGEGGGTLMVLVLAGLMITVGLAFKLSAVPFHFWCPDVFEGAVGRGRRIFIGCVERSSDGAAAARGDRSEYCRRARGDQGWFSGGSAYGNSWSTSPYRRIPASDQDCRRLGIAGRSTGCHCSSKFRGPGSGPQIHRRAAGHPSGNHLHVWQSRRLRPNQHQTAARLFDDCARRLHDHGRGGRYPTCRPRCRWPAKPSPLYCSIWPCTCS